MLPDVNAIELDGRSTVVKLIQPHKLNDLMTPKENSNELRGDSLQSWPTLRTANINILRLYPNDYFHGFTIAKFKEWSRTFNRVAHQFIQQLKIQYLQCYAVQLRHDPHRKAKIKMSPSQVRTADLISRYMTLTKDVMPRIARAPETKWPVRNDHCFQRIVLDAVCNGVWYEHLERPAFKNLNHDQAAQAVKLCEDIVSDRVDLHALNNQSLIWRGKQTR